MEPIKNVQDLSAKLIGLGNLAIYLMVSLAVLFIIWNVVIYFVKGSKGDENKAQASSRVIWGLIGLAIIMSVWGLVNILLNTFRTDSNLPRDRVPSADFINNTTSNSGVHGGYGVPKTCTADGLC